MRRAARDSGLHHDARLPSRHLPGRRRHAGSRAAREICRRARARRELHALHRAGNARASWRSSASARINEMVGRSDRLEMRQAPSTTGRRRGSTYSTILYQPEGGREVGRYCQIPQDHGLEKSLDRPGAAGLCQPAIERRREGHGEAADIRNVNRVVGHDSRQRDHAQATVHRACPKTRSNFTSRARPGRASARSSRRGMTLETRRRRQRLLRQGTVRRQDHRLSARGIDFRAGRKHHRRQCGVLRRDRRRGVYPRHGGRAFLRAQQRRATPSSKGSAITAANT